MKRDILLLIFFASFVLLFNLGSGSLSSWDEAFYAQVSREIIQTNNWTDLHWGGTVWSDKPPLYMWVTALFYKMFGVSEFSARLFSSAAGIAVVIFTYLFASRIFSRRTGLLAAIMMISTYHFVLFSKMGTLDVTFTLFLVLALYSFMAAADDPKYIICTFICFGLAFLTKGVGALLIPLILGLYVLTARRWKMVVNRYFLIGLCCFLLIAGSWYGTAWLRHGQHLLRGHFFEHLVKRTTTVMDGHHGTWLTYFNVVLYKGKPWGAVGLIAFPFFLFHTAKKRETENYLLVFWIVVVFCVFSAVRTKLHWYILPVYPAIAAVAGWGAERILKRYSVAVIAIISLCSCLYFGIKKDVFTLDYNPEIKRFSETLRGIAHDGGSAVYLYGTGDPGVRFYFGGFSSNIRSESELKAIQKEKNAIIVAEAGTLSAHGIRGKVIPFERNDLIAIKVEQ